MARPKKTIKAKEPVRIRGRKLRDGNISLYLDIYSKGVRKVESLGLYIVPEITPLDKERNRQTRAIAEKVKSERIIAIQNFSIGKFEKIKRIGMTLLDWMNQYAESNLNLSQSTIRGRRECATRIKDFLEENVQKTFKLANVDKDFCRNFLAYLKTAPNKSKTTEQVAITQGGAYHIQTIFTGALNKAVKEELLPRNPMMQLDPKEKFHAPESTREYLTIEELKKAIKTPCKFEKTKHAFIFSCFTGLRMGDIMSLTWAKVQDSPDGKFKYMRVKMEKTQKWINVPLSSEAVKWLYPKDDANEPIFNLRDASVVEKHIKIWMKDAGINKHITFHCARHTFATTMLTAGVDLYTVSKLMGHSKISTTEIYAKIVDKLKVEAVDKLDHLFD